MSITRVNTNYEAMFARQNLVRMEMDMGKSLARISSGKRIVTSADDPSSVAMLAVETAQMRGARVGQQNIQESIEILRFTDAMLGTMEDVLLEMRDLCIRQQNDATLTTGQMSSIDQEYQGLYSSINATSQSSVEWNGKKVMQGELANNNIQYGGNPGMKMTLSSAAFTTNLDVTTIGVAQATISSAANASTALGQIDTALGTLGGYRANYGSMMRLLELQLKDQMAAEHNHAAAVSTIGDADIASEITRMTTSQILAQSATAMLGQANTAPQIVLQLL